jgi:hypothetical protein
MSVVVARTGPVLPSGLRGIGAMTIKFVGKIARNLDAAVVAMTGDPSCSSADRLG